MHAIRLKAAMHIHAQKKKGGTLTADDVPNESDKGMASIVNGDVYYAGFTFRGALAPHFAMNGLDTAYADASHMDGKGSSTYGTFYEVQRRFSTWRSQSTPPTTKPWSTPRSSTTSAT